ncbi:MAG: sigma factor-like helix-turn-helix DNA-binding protein [Patescibacteria group bacterium]|jgi:DNA-directed RNA polymerase delta subunit
MDQNNSILDRIISSKKTNEIEQFNPTEVVSLLLKNLTSREEDVLRRRHGLLGKERETLEKIGETYQVTRERIRQIESTGIKKIKKIKNFNDIISPVEATIFSVLEQYGGVINQEMMLKLLLQAVGDTSINRQNIIFIISELLKHKFKEIKLSIEFKKSWQILHAPILLMKESINELLRIIQEKSKPVILDDVISEFQKTEFYQKNQIQLSVEAIHSYLEISSKISKNPFNEYGLIEWGSIIPKRMNDKIYLILKKYGKPLHFTEIAKRINDAKFDTRKAYPPTVHNELILNDQYVLVGRGIYALKEWGYKPGVVANVLKEIIQKNEKPLTRDDLVEKVLEQRLVKKNTIHLALTDKTKFKKLSDGTYALVE